MKIIFCDMLDCNGTWGNVKLKFEDFKFKYYYDKKNKNIQVWEGSNKEIFILKNIKVKEEENEKLVN